LRRAARAAKQEFSAELKLVAPSMRESAFSWIEDTRGHGRRGD
jgi:hypothetical protein